MQLEHIEELLVIVEEGNITRAATRLNISQPALTQHVKALERELGVALLRRHGRGVDLTPVGRLFLKDAQSGAALIHKGTRAAQRAKQVGEVSIRLATVKSLSAGLLPPVVKTMQQKQPGLRLELFEFGHASQVEDAVLSQGVDIAIGPAPKRSMSFVEPLFEETFVAILPPNVRESIELRHAVSLQTLANERWVLFHSDHGLSDLVSSALEQAEVIPRVAIRTSQVDAAINLVVAGLGVSIIPATNLALHQLEIARKIYPELKREINIYSQSEPDRQAQDIIKAFKDYVKLERHALERII